ncbi:p47 [Venturia canescens]|uniref:P47 n=1 Tax=Venturia canescens TaxID=32260 RepID=A0ACB9ZHH5_9HYME|nr:uncharacterized LOC122408204 [Venturia canescens]KAI5630599.1 p47 [Venturia canescens]
MMQSTAQSHTESSLEQDIVCLASRIMHVIDDNSVEPQARAIAQYMLHSRDMKLEYACELLARPGARNVVNKLLDCESEFMGPTPRALGIDVVAFMTAGKIQQSLDVKHYQKTKASNVDNCESASRMNATMSAQNKAPIIVDRIIPLIKTDLLYSDPKFIWIRYHAFDNRAIETELMNTLEVTVLTVEDTIYEVYFAKSTRVVFNKAKIEKIFETIERNGAGGIIFCSELKYFNYNSLLFLSNYVKFTYCYMLRRSTFDPKDFDEVQAMTIYLTYGLLFVKTSNLTSMPLETHGPLIAYTGERPSMALSKFKSDRVYVNEGTRAMQSMDRGSDIGARSNYVEIVSTLRLDDACLSNIL